MLPKLLLYPIHIYKGVYCPGVATYKAFRGKQQQLSCDWLKYWITYALLSMLGGLADARLYAVPYYDDVKLLICVCMWMGMPGFSVWLCDKLLFMVLHDLEPFVDSLACQLKWRLRRCSKYFLFKMLPQLIFELLPCILKCFYLQLKWANRMLQKGEKLRVQSSIAAADKREPLLHLVELRLKQKLYARQLQLGADPPHGVQIEDLIDQLTDELAEEQLPGRQL